MAPLVPVLTTTTVFEARLLAARLGADGIWCELRGNVDGPYPIGPVQVLVGTGDVEVVRALLLADAVEAVFEDASEQEGEPTGEPGPAARHAGWLAPVAILIALVGWTLARVALLA